jgi:hypothetical protein
MGTRRNDVDPVRTAEAQVGRAQAALKANLEEQEQRTRAVAELEEAMGADPDAKGAVVMGAQARVHEARIRRLLKDERTLQAALKEAEAALVKAKADQAQKQITAQHATLDRLNAAINEGLATLLRLIAEHEEVVTGRDRLAHAHDLPLPGRRRFLLAPAALRSREADLLRDRLKAEYAFGGVQVKAGAEAPPVGFVPSA